MSIIRTIIDRYLNVSYKTFVCVQGGVRREDFQRFVEHAREKEDSVVSRYVSEQARLKHTNCLIAE